MTEFVVARRLIDADYFLTNILFCERRDVTAVAAEAGNGEEYDGGRIISSLASLTSIHGGKLWVVGDLDDKMNEIVTDAMVRGMDIEFADLPTTKVLEDESKAE